VLVSIITYLLIAVEVLCSMLLIGVILLQRTKAQGAGMAFGAGVGESLFGSQVGNVLTRTTVVLGIIFLVNTALLGVLMPGRKAVSVADRIKDTPAAPALPSPVVPPAGGEAPLQGEFGAPAEGAAPAASAPESVPVPAPSVETPEAVPSGESAAPSAPPESK
jgi:preprotein translocase subunit SecG